MPDEAYIGFRDYSGEISRSKINTIDLTAANLAAQQALLATLVTEIDPIVRGTIAEIKLQVVTPGSSTPPTDEEAQIEKGWLVLYQDSQQYLDPGPDTILNPGFGKIFQAVLPTATYTTHLLGESDFADLTETDVAAFVTAFEELAVSPYGGSTTVLSLQVVGSRR
jgi:hypothetical protein